MTKIGNNGITFENFVKAKTFSPFSEKYVYFDTKDFLADMIFVKYNIPVKFYYEYGKDENPYCCVFCKIRKKYEPKFLISLNELKGKMLLMGHTDYKEFCLEMQKTLNDVKNE